MVLSQRFKSDGKSVFKLNKLQLKKKKEVENKINSKHYKLENISCPICLNKDDVDTVSEKERYGFKLGTVICKKCGFSYLQPRLTLNSYAEFYDKEYRDFYTGNKGPSKDFYQTQLRQGEVIYTYLKKNLKKEISGKFVVEIGPGAGGILDYFKQKGNDVCGFDYGSEYIEYGKKKGIDLRQGTVKDLNKLKRKPDIIIYSHVLEHTLNPLEEVKTLSKYISKDTLVYIEVPGILNIANDYRSDFLGYVHIAHPFNFTLKTLKNLMSLGGYSCIGGDEVVRSIFKLSGKPKKIDFSKNNDYRRIKKFLVNEEKEFKSFISIKKIKRNCFQFGIISIKKLGLYNFVRKTYYKLRK